MNRKNVIRTVTAIAVVLLLGWSFFYFSDDTRGFKPVDTSEAMSQISGGNVKSAQIDDREQQLRLTLNKGNGDTDNSDKIITKYPNGYAVDLFNALTAKNAKVSTVVRNDSLTDRHSIVTCASAKPSVSSKMSRSKKTLNHASVENAQRTPP